MYIYVHTYTHIFTHTTYIYIYVHTYTHIFTHTYIYIYIHAVPRPHHTTGGGGGQYHTPTTPQGGGRGQYYGWPMTMAGGVGTLGHIYIYIKSRYVFTGNQGVSSLATGPLGPRWPPAKLRSFTSLQMVHTHTHLPASICLNSWCFNPLLSGDVKWKPAGHKKSVSICFLRNYPSQQNVVLN